MMEVISPSISSSDLVESNFDITKQHDSAILSKSFPSSSSSLIMTFANIYPFPLNNDATSRTIVNLNDLPFLKIYEVE